MLEVEGLTVRYGAVLAARDVSLRVERGVVALLGANGAGKTSTLRALSGLVRPTSGRVRFDGEDITGAATHTIVGRGLCQVPEGREVFAELSVLDNLRLGAYRRRDRRGIAQDLQRVYEWFPILHERRSQHAGTLSGGEQQMMALGRALMGRPKMLLLDEPSHGLAPRIVAKVFTILDEICRELELRALVVEQDAAVALSVASFGYVMQAGQIVHSGTSAELSSQDVLRDLYLGGTVKDTP